MSDSSIVLRVRRKNQNFFIMCSKKDSFLTVKEQLCLAVNGEWSPDDLRLLLPKTQEALEDAKSLSDHQEIQDNSELYVVTKIADEEYETVDLVTSDSDAMAS